MMAAVSTEADGYAAFTVGEFDAVAYASKAIQGSDIATSLAQLTIGIDTLNRQLQQQIIAHNDDLLRQVTGIDELDDVLSLARGGLDTLQLSMSRLHEKIRDPFNEISTRTVQLERLLETTELLRQLVRYLSLSKRLRSHLNTGVQDLAKAAQALNEIEGLLKDKHLVSLSVVASDRAWIEGAHQVVLGQAEEMLQTGLSTLQNHSDVGTAVHVFYNMDQLAPRVAQVMQTIHSHTAAEIKRALDVKSSSNAANAASSANADPKDGPNTTTTTKGLGGIRRMGEPTGNQTSAWTSTLWLSLEKLMDVLAGQGQKVIMLEQTLSRKRDPSSHSGYLDDVLKVLNSNGLVAGFWAFVGETIEKEIAHATKHSSFLQNALQSEYPKLLRLFHMFFQRVQTISNVVILSGGGGVQTNANTVNNNGSSSGSNSNGNGASEGGSAVSSGVVQQVIRKALVSLETAYLSKSLTRMFDPINLAFPSSTGGNTTLSKVPTKSDVSVIVKVITSELEMVGFDVALLKAVIRNVAKAVKLFAVKSENATGVYKLTPTSTPTDVHIRNIDTLNALYILYDMVFKSLLNSTTASGALQRADIVDALEDAMKSVQQLMQSVAEPLIQAVADTVEGQLSLVHREDFSTSAASQQQQSSNSSATPSDAPPCSKYMKDTCATIAHLQRHYLDRIDCPTEIKAWVVSLASYLVNMFLRHISIVRPLGDGGKMRMATDMAQFELGLAPLFGASTGLNLASIGKPYRALRAFRPLLFLDTAQIAARHHRRDVDPVLVAHLLIVRSNSNELLLLPHTRAGWTPSDYVAWLDTHTAQECRALLQNNLTAYAADVTRRGDKQYTQEYPILTRLLQESDDDEGEEHDT